MNRAALLTFGTFITLASAAIVVFLIFFAEQLHARLLLAMVIFFQVSFIWTCAEFIDRPDEILPRDENTGPNSRY